MAPYISNPDDLVYYDEYDITECLVPGKNVLGIMLGNGMQNAPGGQIWDFDIAAFRGAPRTAFCVSTEYIDGGIDIFEADSSVKTAPSPVIFDDLRCGCYYDARLEIPGWSEPDLTTARGKRPACGDSARRKAPVRGGADSARARDKAGSDKKMQAQGIHNPRRRCQRGEKIASDERDGFLYDFGVNSAGTVKLRISGERGRQIDLQFGEYLRRRRAGHEQHLLLSRRIFPARCVHT